MVKVKSPKNLAKFVAYILERRPDEFGLVLDRDGYVKIKEFLKALNEEKGWRHVRRFHLNEILYSLPHPPFEILDNRIRAKRREHLPRLDAAPQLPKLLYTSVRKRAHPHVMQKGLFPSGYHQIVLSATREMAERMGKRTDAQAVILTVHAQSAVEKGVLFQQAGEILFLAAGIPPGCFSGPPLPKEKPGTLKQKQTAAVKAPNAPGSFQVDPAKVVGLKGTATPKKDPGWREKKERRKKQKRKRQRPPWRR